MALFGKKKVETTEEAAPKKVAAKKTTKKTDSVDANPSTDVKAVKASDTTVPSKSAYGYRITEKATTLADKNVYVLNVPKTINKTILKKDLETTHKVTVLSINIVNSPKKTKLYRGKLGQRGGGKKAYITLKAGDSIVL